MSKQNYNSEEYIGLFDRLFTLLLHILPHHFLSSLMYGLTRSR